MVFLHVVFYAAFAGDAVLGEWFIDWTGAVDLIPIW